MASIRLTAKQKKAVQQAKATGRRSIVVESTHEQKLAYQSTLAEVEAERKEITRQAQTALNEQRQFESHIAQITQLLATDWRKRKISLRQLSELTGISRQELSRIKSGEKRNPTFNTLLRIANALDKVIVVTLRDSA